MWQPCLYCSGNRAEPDHDLRCDGKQGAIEARYPHVAGFKAQDTSVEAAATTDAARLRDRVVTWLQAQGAQTADECAGCLGCSVLAIRPRFSELLALGRIRDTGMRRPNASSGKRAIVWELINRRW
jgi:hypothetical protein